MEEIKTELTTLEEKVNKIVQKYLDEKSQETCKDEYYKNKYLDHAVENHNSVQCIGRTYAELLHTGSLLHTHNNSDLYHANQIFTYLKTYVDSGKIAYLDELLKLFLDDLENENEYILLNCCGRKKSFRSLEAKVRYKILMIHLLNELLDNFENFPEFTQFNADEQVKVREHLTGLLNSVSKKNPTKDLLGIRFIINKIGHNNCEENELIQFCYKLKEDLIEFFAANGIELLESKDYIAEPKDDGYQSLHLIFEILGAPIEFQIRTGKMHYVSEYGTASHAKVYKDTILQKFTQEFLYNLSKRQEERLISNETNCFLKSYHFFERQISKTQNGEVPVNPSKLNKTLDKNVISLLNLIHKKA